MCAVVGNRGCSTVTVDQQAWREVRVRLDLTYARDLTKISASSRTRTIMRLAWKTPNPTTGNKPSRKMAIVQPPRSLHVVIGSGRGISIDRCREDEEWPRLTTNAAPHSTPSSPSTYSWYEIASVCRSTKITLPVSCRPHRAFARDLTESSASSDIANSKLTCGVGGAGVVHVIVRRSAGARGGRRGCWSRVCTCVVYGRQNSRRAETRLDSEPRFCAALPKRGGAKSTY